mgnify:CR=1 FL=1
MADDQLDDDRLRDPALRDLFKPTAILDSEWYQQRIDSRLDYMRGFWEGRIAYLQQFLDNQANAEAASTLGIAERIAFCKEARSILDEDGTRHTLVGSLGREPTYHADS